MVQEYWTAVHAGIELRDAIRFRDIAFGDLPGIYERMVKDPETGEVRKVVENLRQFNPQALGKALELIGRNRLVQAFQDSVEVSHAHHLEEMLNERTKQVEAAAAALQLLLVKDSPEPTSP